jgi:O-acetyl-ADP-ribose deacetylase (regulator of RNase III)
MDEKKQVNKSTISLIRGDITDIDVGAFVFYARNDLALGTGFGTAISSRGGSEIQKELDELKPIATGEAVITSGGKLKAKNIIHAVGPRFQEKDTDTKLRTTIINALKLAEDKRIEKIAFPAMGAGFYGIPLDLCAQVLVDTVENYLWNNTGIKEVIICTLDSREYGAFKSRL